MNTATHPFIIEPSQPANCSVIWMHGLGATAHDFEDIVPLLQLPEHCHVRFIFPQAPTQPITINGGMPMPGWYDIYHLDRLEHQDQAGIETSAATISMLIDMEVERGIAANNVVLAGFSQGGAMALHTGLRYNKSLAGIMALSCYLPLAELLADQHHSANRATPLFIAHGQFDPVLPLVLSELSVAELNKHQYNIEQRHYPMAHEICLDEIKDIAHWLSTVLSPPAAAASPH